MDNNKDKSRPIDFSANINSLGFPGWVRKVINRNMEAVLHYPDPEQRNLKQAASEYYSIPPGRILFGNGASDFISILPEILNIDHLIIPIPSYSEYNNNKIKTSFLLMNEAEGFHLDMEKLQQVLNSSGNRKLVFIGQPNNPTGKSVEIPELVNIAEKNKDTFFCIDESFSDFIPGYTTAAESVSNIIIIKSMTKFYGIPGLRLGFCIGSSDIIEKIKKYQTPWSVNILAQKVGEKLFTDQQFYDKSVAANIDFKKNLVSKLSLFPWLKVFPGEANFILLKITNPQISFKNLNSYLNNNSIMIRDCSNFKGLDSSYFRIAVRDHHDNMALIDSLKAYSDKREILMGTEQYNLERIRSKSNKVHPLMIQGTASNAGKSIITAGLCRIFYQDGYTVAPFKAQNMSNNSAVTLEGKEIGRAQALQAKACNITPDTRMNPVLLKPSSERRSQVVINGLPSGHMTVKNWKKFKSSIIKEVEKSYDSLALEYEVIIIEGAGSPGEVNLKENDIVNMGMARYADSPVLITGDIDRGGVYASLIGTMDVFEEWERDLVKGYIINRFRGDASFLQSAHSYLYEYTGKKVLGTVPYIQDLNLPEEDSVSLKEGSYFNTNNKSLIKIALIDLPYISNFTDIDPLRMETDIEICLIKKSEDLDNGFSAVIIPGSKNTQEDLLWLKSKGFQSKLAMMRNSGVYIIGICGGFQILGKTVSDRQHVESQGIKTNDHAEALGMLDIETTFHSDKQLKLKEVIHVPSGCRIRGYEIHHGISHINSGRVIIDSDDGLLGSESPDKKVWGTYLHGIFDNDKFRLWFLNTLRNEKGLPVSETPSYIYNIDKSLDRLADILRESVDIDQIKLIMGL